MQPMGTVVTYNGVKLVNCLTKEFLQEPQREPSNTDQEHQKFRIVVESIVLRHVLREQSRSWRRSGWRPSLADEPERSGRNRLGTQVPGGRSQELPDDD
jgi:hypothetical protein